MNDDVNKHIKSQWNIHKIQYTGGAIFTKTLSRCKPEKVEL